MLMTDLPCAVGLLQVQLLLEDMYFPDQCDASCQTDSSASVEGMSFLILFFAMCMEAGQLLRILLLKY